MTINKKLVACVLGSIFTVSAFGTTSQGELSTGSSTGKVDLSMTIAGGGPGTGSILISGLEDINIGSFNAGNSQTDLQGKSDFCVYRTGAGTGEISFSLELYSEAGENNKGDFELVNEGDSAEKISYTVDYYNQVTGGTATSYSNKGDKPVKATNNAELNDGNGAYSCKQDNVSLAVKADRSEASKAKDGKYIDTLVLVVSTN